MILIYNLTEESDEVTNLEDFASDREKSVADKGAAVSKVEAAKAYKTGTNLEYFKCDQCNYT